MSVNLFFVLDVFENHYFISATKWCMFSIIKTFISVCVCVYVTERERQF